MYVKWKTLISLGIAFWCLMCCTDLLGQSTWKRCSHNLDDILNEQYNEFKRQQQSKIELPETTKEKMNWPVLLWNVCAFLCSLVFCSVVRSMCWFLWKIIKIYDVFRCRKALTDKLTAVKGLETESSGPETSDSAKVLFHNQLFANVKIPEEIKEVDLPREIEELRKERSGLAQQLMIAQKENLTARQQLEEYKLETFMMKEKLARITNSMKDNIISKDLTSAKKAQKEVGRDNDVLRNKLGSLENNYSKLEYRFHIFDKQDSDRNIGQFPEKDTTNKPVVNEPADVDISKFQKNVVELQQNNDAFGAKKVGFEANSKISVDLDESSLDNSNNTDERDESRKADIDVLKQNLLNYNAYKVQMLRPKLKLNNAKERIYSDTTGSSSDDNTTPHRIISSTVEFQNFLKTLTSNSRSSINFENFGQK